MKLKPLSLSLVFLGLSLSAMEDKKAPKYQHLQLNSNQGEPTNNAAQDNDLLEKDDLIKTVCKRSLKIVQHLQHSSIAIKDLELAQSILFWLSNIRPFLTNKTHVNSETDSIKSFGETVKSLDETVNHSSWTYEELQKSLSTRTIKELTSIDTHLQRIKNQLGKKSTAQNTAGTFETLH